MLKVEIATDIGRRKDNQDFAGTFKNDNDVVLAIVCDGLGGHRGGDVASEMAVSHIGNHWKETSFTEEQTNEIKSWLNEVVNQENAHILNAASRFQDLEGMGTTLVAAVFLKEVVMICNVGDSRAYGGCNGEVKQLTIDHTLKNELVLSGKVSPEEAESHINKNALTRSLGVNEMIEADFFIYPKTDYDHILLCSDGLSGVMSTSTIAQIIEDDSLDLKSKTDKLIQTAIDYQSTDNITVVLVDLSSSESSENEEVGS